ncbi:unnamed protein product [Gongylonema pulchrum]|uniref:Uncharacterized protein n=1 Tax=Gongylonema pulchrum TaxID=637853 RepID=A0A183ERV2_9BILA|nr:unnamed protein product [Gongylonema pulchrum]
MKAPGAVEGRPIQKKRATGRTRLTRKRRTSAMETGGVDEVAIDEAEKIYCLCRQVSVEFIKITEMR